LPREVKGEASSVQLTSARQALDCGLPFENMSGDTEQAYFADGNSRGDCPALSRIRWLFVIARNSSFTYKGRAVHVKQIGQELGVRFILEGSVSKAGDRVRITGQLLDALNGTHLWADRFEGQLQDIFDLQDRVTASVAGAIAEIGANGDRASEAQTDRAARPMITNYTYPRRAKRGER
jgi:TolB-like protein